MHAASYQRRGGSRILQGWVSNPSERFTGGAKPPTCAPKARLRRGCEAFPRQFQNLDTLRCIFPAFQGITNCMIESAFGVDFAGETTSTVQRDRKLDVVPNWATVYFQKWNWDSSTAINITIVKIAEMIYLTRHLLTKTKVHQQVNSVEKAVVKQPAAMDSYELLGNFVLLISTVLA